MQAVIIAGGKGTRLKELTGDLPKPLVDICGKPLLEHQILLAKTHGIERILLLTGFGAEAIEDYCGDGSKWGLRIQYHREPQPLGTAGAVLDAFPHLVHDFIVIYADTMLNVDLRRFSSFHTASPGITAFLHPNDHPQDSDLIEIDEANRITALHPYPHPPGQYFRNLVNAALYVVRKDAIAPWYQRRAELSYPFDFAKHLFPEMIAGGGNLRGYVSREYIKDAGTPERVYRVREDYLSGRIDVASLQNPKPAVFFDRDGTLNVDSGWIKSPAELALLPGAAQAVRAVNQSGRLAVVVTNQTVIARGDCSESGLRLIHNKFEWLLGQEHAFVDGIYYCPHHPHKGFPGERPELKVPCDCRKPATGLFEKAAADLNIDAERSWMIGDSADDMEAAMQFGIHSILVKTGRQGRQPSRPPDFVCTNVLDAVQFIAQQEEQRQP